MASNKTGPEGDRPAQLGRTVVERDRLQPPAGQDFWVYGYGSLMWHPGFPHLEVRKARLRGYHRRFCVYSVRYRGTPERPGLVLGLDRGGSCMGLAYRVPAAEGEAVMDYLYEREMITGVYIPRWVTVQTGEGDLAAATFVVDPAHPQYAGRLSVSETAELIVQGYGQRGPCGEYLENTVGHLEALGIDAGWLKRLLHTVRRLNGEAEAPGPAGD